MQTIKVTVTAFDAGGARLWSRGEVEALGLHTDVRTAAQILGISRSTAYELIARGQFPVKTFYLGKKIRVCVASLLELLAS